MRKHHQTLGPLSPSGYIVAVNITKRVSHNPGVETEAQRKRETALLDHDDPRMVEIKNGWVTNHLYLRVRPVEVRIDNHAASVFVGRKFS